LGLKNVFLDDDKSLVYELSLALVSLWLLVNLIKKENLKEKRPIDFFIILLKDIFFLLLYYYFVSFWF